VTYGEEQCARADLDFIGLFHLFKLFKTRYCFDPDAEVHDPFDFRCVPKPNDFSDIPEYFVRKSIVAAIANARDEQGQVFPKVQQFLVELLTYNDNAENMVKLSLFFRVRRR
jgi:transcription initiation factor TFIID subunit 2